jgi:hypothetical protein
MFRSRPTPAALAPTRPARGHRKAAATRLTGLERAIAVRRSSRRHGGHGAGAAGGRKQMRDEPKSFEPLGRRAGVSRSGSARCPGRALMPRDQWPMRPLRAARAFWRLRPAPLRAVLPARFGPRVGDGNGRAGRGANTGHGALLLVEGDLAEPGLAGGRWLRRPDRPRRSDSLADSRNIV